MTKHIHIHLPPGARVTAVRSGDSGDWDESKHKRADDGKFSSGGGGGGKGPQTPAGKKEAQRREAFRAKAAEPANKAAVEKDKAALKKAGVDQVARMFDTEKQAERYALKQRGHSVYKSPSGMFVAIPYRHEERLEPVEGFKRVPIDVEKGRDWGTGQPVVGRWG